jgi:hypothetical protein
MNEFPLLPGWKMVFLLSEPARGMLPVQRSVSMDCSTANRLQALRLSGLAVRWEPVNGLMTSHS